MHSRVRRYLSIFVFSILLWLILCRMVQAPLAEMLDKDFVYYGHTGLPAPCPPPKKGYWPRDCP
jgi:hypothetical protein